LLLGPTAHIVIGFFGENIFLYECISSGNKFPSFASEEKKSQSDNMSGLLSNIFFLKDIWRKKKKKSLI